MHVDRHLLIATPTTPARCCVAAGEFNGQRLFAEAVIDETTKGGDREKFKAAGSTFRLGNSYRNQWWVPAKRRWRLRGLGYIRPDGAHLQARYGGSEPKRVGLKHPSIAPYGSFTCADDRELVFSIQNEREWANFCRVVLGDDSLHKDPRFCSNAVRTRHRDELEAIIQGIFSGLSHAQAVDRLTDAQTAYDALNSVQDLIVHPQLRTRAMTVNGHSVEVPAAPYRME